MSDVYSDFLDQMEEKEDYESSGGVGIVREIKIETGWHGFESGHDFWKYWKPFPSKEGMKSAFFSAKEAMELDGSSKSPRKAIKLTIYPDDSTKGEMRDLYAIWMTDTYAIISKSLRENKLPLNEKFWGRVSYVADPNAIAKGEEGKTEEYNGKATFPNIRVPVQAFANKQEAMEFMEANQPQSNNNNNYSAKAMAEFGNDVKVLEMNGAEILETYDNALNGVQYMNSELPDAPSPFVLSEYEAILKKYTADIWKIESGDIDILRDTTDKISQEEIPY